MKPCRSGHAGRTCDTATCVGRRSSTTDRSGIQRIYCYWVKRVRRLVLQPADFLLVVRQHSSLDPEPTDQTATPESWLHGFLNYCVCVGLDTPQNLMNAGGPHNLYICIFTGAQTKVQSLVIRRKIASCSRRETDLAIDLNAGTVTIAIALFSPQRNCQPVQFPAAVQIQQRTFAKTSSDHIHPAIVVHIAECRSPPGYGHIRSSVGLFELALVIQCQQGRFPITQ